jgi:predicted nucleic acid-binding protein
VKAYLDSSSFAKRFVNEEGSDKVEETCAEATELGLSVICVPEIVSALNRRRRERALSPGQYEKAKHRVFDDIRDADIIHLTAPVIDAAVRLLEASPVRAMDALHIACALEWGAELFASSDKKQLVAAKRAGLRTRQI